MKRIWVMVGLVLAIFGIFFSSVPITANQRPTNAPFARIKRSTSTNWSGYAEAVGGSNGALVGVAGSVTDVKGGWVVRATTGTKSGYYYSSAGRY